MKKLLLSLIGLLSILSIQPASAGIVPFFSDYTVQYTQKLSPKNPCIEICNNTDRVLLIILSVIYNGDEARDTYHIINQKKNVVINTLESYRETSINKNALQNISSIEIESIKIEQAHLTRADVLYNKKFAPIIKIVPNQELANFYMPPRADCHDPCCCDGGQVNNCFGDLFNEKCLLIPSIKTTSLIKIWEKNNNELMITSDSASECLSPSEPEVYFTNTDDTPMHIEMDVQYDNSAIKTLTKTIPGNRTVAINTLPKNSTTQPKNIIIRRIKATEDIPQDLSKEMQDLYANKKITSEALFSETHQCKCKFAALHILGEPLIGLNPLGITLPEITEEDDLPAELINKK